MIIFIDESGDPGFKTKEGSSKYLVISLVIFENLEEVQNTRKQILEYRNIIKYPVSSEFKFNKTRRKIVIGLLKTHVSCNFTIRAIVANKEKIQASGRKTGTEIYNYLLVLLLEEFLPNNQKNEIWLDGIVEREFKKTILKYLRKYIKNRKIILKTVNSKNDDLIQLADVVVGSIARSYLKDKHDAEVYKRIIEKKITKEWVLKRSDLEPILK
ncbi:DUF3800 domain-containing protein [Patescibacteria group bacterium]|nr:DUF3800 domain-containing protein [Patescibacteria group bacterium]